MHWQIYDIDQHTSQILCEHSKDGISCHYMTDHEADMKAHINRLHESSLKEKLANNSYVTENASWSIKDLERSYKTFPESCCGTSYKLIVWVIMDTDAEDPRTKANNFSVPVYASQDWEKMKNFDTQTIKEMLKDLAEKKESTPKVADKQKKIRPWKAQHHKSKTTVESESSDSADKRATKSAGDKRVKSSSKPSSRSSEMETKTISTNSCLLMPEIVDSGQKEFNEHHRAKLSGATDIKKSMVSSSHDDTMKFGLTQVSRQLSEHLEQTKASADQGGRITRSAAQVL